MTNIRYAPSGRDLTENGPQILDNFPDLHSPTYFLAFSFLCNTFSYFLEFNGKWLQILKKHSVTFLIIFTNLHI